MNAMHGVKPITLRGAPLAGGRVPVICTPLVGRTRDDILGEVEAVLPKRPDILEWRADFYRDLGDAPSVVETARRLKSAAGDVPVLFTRRSASEGGEKVDVDEDRVVDVYLAVAASGAVDAIDYELSNPASRRERIRGAARGSGVALVLSYHNFQATPDASTLVATFRRAHEGGADVAKVATMPRSPEDVLALLSATLEASRALPIPLISMSMGPIGSVSRMVGGVFGSALTFAVGKSSSAPGQIPIEELRSVLNTVRRSTGTG